jgi:hypothetical protein
MLKPDEVLPDPILTSLRGAQQMLGGTSRYTVYELINAGLLKTVRLGKRHMVAIASIRQLIDSGGSKLPQRKRLAAQPTSAREPKARGRPPAADTMSS